MAFMATVAAATSLVFIAFMAGDAASFLAFMAVYPKSFRPLFFSLNFRQL
jgi:hypothetical protein